MQSAMMKAKVRGAQGKGAAGRLRRAGIIPAVVYGKEKETSLIQVEAKELDKVLKMFGSRTLVKLDIDESGRKNSKTVLIKDVQTDAVEGRVVHLDLQEVSMNEKVATSIPIVLVGEESRGRKTGIVQHFLREVQVEALPSKLPSRATLDIGSLEVGDILRVSDLDLGPDVVVHTPADEVVVSVTQPAIQQQEEKLPEENTSPEAAEEAEGEEKGE